MAISNKMSLGDAERLGFCEPIRCDVSQRTDGAVFSALSMSLRHRSPLIS
jgi:hypothetical protein